MDRELICSGDITQKFLVWLECNFGYYTCGVLVDRDWDSNVLYQYDSQVNHLRSSYSDFDLKNINKWKIEKEFETYILSFYEDDLLWRNYTLSWLNFEKPSYVNFDYISSI